MKMRKNVSLVRMRGYFNKFEGYFRTLNKDKVFQRKVAAIRKRYSIQPKFDSKLTILSDARFEKESFYEEVKKMSEQYYFPSFAESTLRLYVLTNEWITTSLQSEIEVVDINDTYIEDSKEGWLAFRKSLAKLRPLAIEFSPYTSSADLIAYIKKAYKGEIRPRQQKYIDKNLTIGKGRYHNLEGRNEFIWEKHLEGHSAKKIMSLVREAGFTKLVSYTYINDIIRERKERERRERK